MVCPRQIVPIPCLHLWEGFNPNGPKKGLFVLLRGYIDESYGEDQNVFSLSCLMARGKDWDDMERRWKLHLKAKNRELAAQGRKLISRYHASACSGRREDFEVWTRNERDAFVLGLFGAFRRFESHTVAIEMQLDELCEVFPEWAGDRLKAAYHVLTQLVMHQIVQDFKRNAPGSYARVTLFHDRTGGKGKGEGGKYDPTILRAFNQMMNFKNFDGKEYFTTIAPLTWEDSIALQPADLVAFECFKQAEARLEARKSRRSFEALLDMAAFGIHSMGFRKDAMIEWREKLEKSQNIQPLDV